MNPRFKTAAVAGLFGIHCLASSLCAAWMDDSFSDGERSTQNLPSSAAWFSSERDGTGCNSSGLVSAPNRHLLAYFAEPSKPVELRDGQPLTVRLLFSVKKPLSRATAFRVALLDSGRARVRADGRGSVNPIFEGDAGYGAFLNFNTGSAISIFRRGAGISGKLISGQDAYAKPLVTSEGHGAAFADGQDYTLKLTLLKQGGTVKIACGVEELEGYRTETQESADPVTAFDTVVIYGARSGMSGFTIKSVTVE